MPTDRFFGLISARAVLAARLRTPEVLWVCAESSVHGLARVISDARALGVPIRTLPKAALSKELGRDVCDVALDAGPRSFLTPEALVAHLQPLSNPWLMAMDGIDDPHQLGAVFRTAGAVGVTALVMPRSMSAVDPDLVARSSAGTSESATTCVAGDLASTLRLLSNNGFRVIAADPEGAKSIYDVSLCGKMVLVLGGRLRGLSAGTLSACAERVSLPMDSGVPSLTVASCAGAILYEAWRQRHLPRHDS